MNTVSNLVDIMGETFEVSFYNDPFKSLHLGDMVGITMRDDRLAISEHGLTAKLLKKEHINYSERVKYTFDIVYIPVLFVIPGRRHPLVYDGVTNNVGYSDLHCSDKETLHLIGLYGRGVEQFTKVRMIGNYIWLRTGRVAKIGDEFEPINASNEDLALDILTMPHIIREMLKEAWVRKQPSI